MRSLCTLFALLLFCSAVFCLPHDVQAEPQAFSSTLERVNALAKSDPEVKKLSEWEALAADISSRAEGSKADAPQFLFELGKLHRRIFQRRGSRASLARAVEAFERIARDHSGNDLADDALLAVGDLRQDGMGDTVAARAAYFEIIDRYSGGNVVREAKKRVEPAPVVPGKSPVAEPVKADDGSDSFRPVGERSRVVLQKTEAVKRPLIVIDAGHGGEDLGAHGSDGVVEKEIVLTIAQQLDELLRDRLRARTFLTRSDDVFIPLPERTRIANEKNADLFISIHANASEYKTASGIETYYLDNTNDKSSLKLAERENMSLQFGAGQSGGDVGFILSDLIQNVKLDDSISLAHKLQKSMFVTLSRYYDGVNNLGVKKAPFHVLVGAHMPCVLAEVSFIDHPVEGRRLADRKYQKLVALALYQGIKEFFTPREERP